MKKAALHNLGCKVNAYETEAMQQLLEEAGYEIVPFTEKADVYVINTCSVTNIADRKSRQMLHKAKKQNPEAIVVGAGCYIQTKEKEALADLAVDVIIGNNQKSQLVAKIREFEELSQMREQSGRAKEAGQTEPVEMTGLTDPVTILQNRTEQEAPGCNPAGAEDFVSAGQQQTKSESPDLFHEINKKGLEFEELPLTQTEEHTRAFIKIQDGCNQFCSYCIIPYARGRVRSRKPENVIEEVTRLARKGFKEFVLTGIHLSSYGTDTGDSLLELIGRINEIEGVERIRLGSLEPRLITEEFTAKLASFRKICPHFHLSLQSGCDETLKRMNRHYSAEEYYQGCRILRRYFHNPAITTDVIVGFPGETPAEFEQTVDFLQKVHFYEMHIFKYSVRQGTRAAVMKNQIPEPVKTKRSARLIALGNQMSEEYRNDWIGKEAEVLFEEPVIIDGKAYYTGYTKEYIKVVVQSEENLSNQIRHLTIAGHLRDEIYIGIIEN